MSAKRRRDWRGMERVCARKKFYSTEQEAQWMAMGEEWRLKKKMYVYQCAVCGGWHLTDMEQRRQ
jgi:hypothetical protein